MRHIYLSLVAGIALLSLNSCEKVVGDGPVQTETRTVASFNEIEFEVPGDLVFIEDDEREVIIEAQRNIIDVIQTYVSGSELRVKVKENTNIRSSKPIHITVKGPGVRSLKLSGSGNLTVPGTLAAADAKLRISGSGKMMVTKVEADHLEASISGSGDIDVIEGTVNSQDLNISGSGNLDLVEVLSKTTITQTSGSGTMKVNVSETLDTRISGSGDVYYKGSPAVTVSISGSGRIIKL